MAQRWREKSSAGPQFRSRNPGGKQTLVDRVAVLDCRSIGALGITTLAAWSPANREGREARCKRDLPAIGAGAADALTFLVSRHANCRAVMEPNPGAGVCSPGKGRLETE